MSTLEEATQVQPETTAFVWGAQVCGPFGFWVDFSEKHEIW